MDWNDFKKYFPPQEIFERREKTDINCPECGKQIYRRTDIVLTSYPAQYQYECDCGWIGYAYH